MASVAEERVSIRPPCIKILSSMTTACPPDTGMGISQIISHSANCAREREIKKRTSEKHRIAYLFISPHSYVKMACFLINNIAFLQKQTLYPFFEKSAWLMYHPVKIQTITDGILSGNGDILIDLSIIRMLDADQMLAGRECKGPGKRPYAFVNTVNM